MDYRHNNYNNNLTFNNIKSCIFSQKLDKTKSSFFCIIIFYNTECSNGAGLKAAHEQN